jgi:hypothetical protein
MAAFNFVVVVPVLLELIQWLLLKCYFGVFSTILWTCDLGLCSSSLQFSDDSGFRCCCYSGSDDQD